MRPAVTGVGTQTPQHLHFQHPMGGRIGGRMGKVTKRQLPVGYPWDCARRDS
jgi:hypothetical protein